MSKLALLKVSSALLALTLGSLLTAPAFAANQVDLHTRKVSKDYLKKFAPKSGLQAGKNAVLKKNGAVRANSGVSGVDTLENWTDSFTEPGFDNAGNPQSVWPYAMVGNAPESHRTTVINAPIIPVTLQVVDASGNVVHDPDTGAPLIQKVTPDIVNAVFGSPLFEPFPYTSGFGQFNDQMQRAEFWDRLHHGHGWESESGWHTLMSPRLKRTRTMSIPESDVLYALNADGTCCEFLLVDNNTFTAALFPPTFPVDNTTVIGAAELAGDMRTRDLTSFLFNNVYLIDLSTGSCCVLGFHEYDFEPGVPSNGNLPRLYVMDYSSWISPGLFNGGFQDITAMSHEISETFNDPFVNNWTPWWLSLDPNTGFGLCQDNLETGDVIEVLSNNVTYSVGLNNRTYHLQNEALFPWFAFESPSPARLGAYSFPDETTLTTLSPSNLLPGCTPAP
ncbi:hypothetical protein Acid345_3119 [Candidatus Koribacter versatilis Ellin345]|uniref:Uncharacterized protein n=1 Tax=Koribacter versatilis (strain Ellin345) TaxID=204669 RepID=Q1ILY0_KORVE|nr:hypothetical protein [Candidatus Koribacter versatilis]ABF42120.1 hypothetical protein Acid345_3119 [Candidatus Koribacter versatilis Ellin345]